jgi:sporulation protein YlmC with PRC-barrel domain
MKAFLAGLLLSTFVTAIASGEEASPTASGFASEGKQDLSAGTSQPGSPNQSSSHVFSAIKGADVKGRGGTTIGTLADILVDERGEVKQIAIATGVFGASKRIFDINQVPFDTLAFDLSEEDVKALPTLDVTTPITRWLVASLVGAYITGTDNASVADIRFLPEAVDRVLINTGRNASSDDLVEIPFSSLRLSGSTEKPVVSLSEDEQRRLNAPADTAQ